MFGYVKPDTPYLYIKDERLYNALYCQACKSIGGTCGQIARFSLTYDIAFMSAVVHNILGIDVKIEEKNCIAHPLIKRPIAYRDDISDALGSLNLILAYYKVNDDVADNGKGRFARFFLSNGYRRAVKRFPQFEQAVKENYEKLRELERKGTKSIDMTADPFAVMLAELSNLLLKDKADEFSYKFFYNLGKWIYIIDALDDYDGDVKAGRYNPFYTAYACVDLKTLKESYGDELSFILRCVQSGIEEGFNGLKFVYNADLIANIALRGTKATTERVLSGKKKNKKKKDK